MRSNQDTDYTPPGTDLTEAEKYAPKPDKYDEETLAYVTITTGPTTHTFLCYEGTAETILEAFGQHHTNWCMFQALSPEERSEMSKHKDFSVSSGFVAQIPGYGGLIVRSFFVSVAEPNGFVLVNPVYDEEVRRQSPGELARFRSSFASRY